MQLRPARAARVGSLMRCLFAWRLLERRRKRSWKAQRLKVSCGDAPLLPIEGVSYPGSTWLVDGMLTQVVMHLLPYSQRR